MKEVEKKRAPEVSGGYFGPLEGDTHQYPVPIGPTPTFPDPPIVDDGTSTNKL